MAEISKQALIVDNNQSFPNNNAGAITPDVLRSYNRDVIDSTVNQTEYTANSGSWNGRIESLTSQTGSYIVTGSVAGDTITLRKNNGTTFNLVVTASNATIPWDNVTGKPSGLVSGSSQVVSILGPLNAFSASQITKDSTLALYTGSINTFTASENTKANTLGLYTGSINAFTASENTKASNLALYTGSINAFTASENTKASTLATYTGSVDTKFNTLGLYTSSINAFTSSENTKASTLATYTGSNDTKWNTLGSISSSFARTNSTNTFEATQNITGDLNITGTIRATTIHTITESASVIFSSGSNVFGDASNDTQTLIGSTIISGSLTSIGNGVITGSLTATNGIIGSIQATNNVISGSSQILALGYATTGSNVFVSSQTITGSLNQRGGDTSLNGNLTISGSAITTGSVRGNVVTQTITSNTASFDFNTANFFELTLVSGSTTRIQATNVRPGQTVSLKITQASVVGGNVTFSPQFDFPSISPYTATQSGSAVDVLTFVTFNDTGSIYSAAVNNLR